MQRRLDVMRNKRNVIPAAAAVLAATFLALPAAHAQMATSLEQAELAGLSPDKQAEVKARAVNGNTVTEVLQTMLLNNVKAKFPASRIVALDFGRGVVIVEVPQGGMKLANFNTTTLALK
jgi:hypothetical protein